MLESLDGVDAAEAVAALRRAAASSQALLEAAG
jgi:hypothetical protein